MFTMWEIRADDGNGKELYGEDYADIYGISRLHFLAAMNKTCDHVSKCFVSRWLAMLGYSVLRRCEIRSG